jgi:glycosyltransferase involved in cell wall biosynthesis
LAKRRKFFNDRGVRNGWADMLFALATLKLLFKVRRGELDALDICATPFLHLPVAAIVAKARQIPAVLTCHEALLAALPEYARERGMIGVRSKLAVSVLRWIYRLGMKLFPSRIAVSQRTARALQEEGFPARETVEFGLDPEMIAPRPPLPKTPEAPVRLIYCGRLTPIKSVDQVLAALLSLRSQITPFHFDIVGEGAERTRLEQMVREAPEVASFHGEVSEQRKQELLAVADAFILGSPREGFSIATLEAMAQGCAVLVVNDPARPNGALDFVRDGQEGVVVAPGLDSLREGLRRLIENSSEREASRRTAWQTAQSYKIGEQAIRLAQVYRELR